MAGRLRPRWATDPVDDDKGAPVKTETGNHLARFAPAELREADETKSKRAAQSMAPARG